MQPSGALTRLGGLFGQPPKPQPTAESHQSREEILLTVTDEELYEIVMARPAYRQFFLSMGNNKDLDNLRSAQAQVKQMRESLQRKLTDWKSRFDISISLEEELKQVQQPASQDIFKAMADAINFDLNNIFQQLEATFTTNQQQLQRLYAENLRLNDLMRDLERRINESGVSLLDFKGVKEQLEKTKTALMGAVKLLEEQKGENANLQKTAAKAEKNLAQTEAEKGALQSTIEEQRERLEFLQTSMRDAKNAEQLLRSRIEALEKAASEKEGLLDSLNIVEGALERSKREKAALSSKKAAAESQLAELEHTVDESQKDELLQRLSQARRLQEAEKELIRLRSENEAMKAKAADYDKLDGDYNKMLTVIRKLPIDAQAAFMNLFQSSS